MSDSDDVDIRLLRKRALDSRDRKKDTRHDELQLHPNEELGLDYGTKKKKKLTKRKKPQEKSTEEDQLIHFVNPHASFMPYSTLSLAVKQTQSVSNVSPISSESPSPVNLYSSNQPPLITPTFQFSAVSEKLVNPTPIATSAAVAKKEPVKPTEKAAQPMHLPADSTKSLSAKNSDFKPLQSSKQPAPKQAGSTRQPLSKKPQSKSKQENTHSRSSSSDSTSSSFSSSSTSSYSTRSSGRKQPQRGSSKKRQQGSSSSSSSTRSSSLSSSSSQSSSSASYHSRDRKDKPHRLSRQDARKRRDGKSHSRERKSYKHRERVGSDDRGHENPHFSSGRGYSRDFNQRKGYRQDSTFNDGERGGEHHRPFNRPYYRNNYRGGNFSSYRGNFHNDNFRPMRGGRSYRGRSYGSHQQYNNYGDRRYHEDRYEDHASSHRNHRREGSSDQYSSEISRSRSSYSSKIGAPIQQTNERKVMRSKRRYDDSFSDSGKHKDSLVTVRKQPRLESSAKSENEFGSELDYDSDMDLKVPSVDMETESKSHQKKKLQRSSSRSSRSSSSSSSSSRRSHFEDQRESINSPIRVSPDERKRSHKTKQGDDHQQDPEWNEDGQKGYSTGTAELEKVSKRLRPDLALRLGPDPDNYQSKDTYTQRRNYYSTSTNKASRMIRGNALEIARQYRLQKEMAAKKHTTQEKSPSSSSADEPDATTDVVNPQPPTKEKSIDPEKEKELSNRIQKIKEQNEKILQRQREIENDIQLYA